MREFDYVVVGAGSAGCVLASLLTEDPSVSVLLLEAGGEDRKREIRVPAAFSRLYGSEIDWGYRTEPQPGLGGRSVYFPRGKVIGGSSSINAQIAVRGGRADYDGWGPGWGWDDVLPFFERSSAGPFAITGLRDPSSLTEAFLAAASEAGLPRADDLNAAAPEGFALSPVNQRRGRRWSVADGYLRPALARSNLTVMPGTHAARIVVESGRARGVELLQEEVRATSEVILCAGAVNSPHLMLVSGIGPADELSAVGVELVHDLPGVGRNLQDHLAAGLLVASTGARTLYSAESALNLVRFLLFGRGPLTSNVAEAVGLVRTRPDLAAPDLELLFAPVLFTDEGLTPPQEDGFTVAAIALQPESAGRVTLRSGDPLEPPLIDPAYLSGPEDLRVLVDGTRLAREIVAASPLSRYVREELAPGPVARSDDELAAQVRGRAQTLYHPVGTCRMGTDEGAVVDPELRVRGLEGLRVVDASVIPRIPRGHTNWPTVMVAEKAADLIRS